MFRKISEMSGKINYRVPTRPGKSWKITIFLGKTGKSWMQASDFLLPVWGLKQCSTFQTAEIDQKGIFTWGCYRRNQFWSKWRSFRLHILIYNNLEVTTKNNEIGLKNLEKSGKFSGILSAHKNGNPDITFDKFIDVLMNRYDAHLW